MIIGNNIETIFLIVGILFLILCLLYILCRISLDNLPINGSRIPDRIKPSDYNRNYYFNTENDIEKGI